MCDSHRIILASDIHNCHVDWYGISNEERMERFVRHMCEEYEKDPYELILLLGDYSLDFWAWGIQGCYVNKKESRTQEFVNKLMPRIPAPWKMIAGNHEQYGEAKWREITGCSRQDAVRIGNWLFILLDSFGANLDPQVHSDGTYSPIDVSFVQAQMEEFPDCRVVLCAHHFDFDHEGKETKELIRDPRIACLFSGHVHLSSFLHLPEEFGGKPLIRTGNYSYSSDPNPLNDCWGFREVILNQNHFISRYITPENNLFLDGKEIQIPYHKQGEICLDF